MLCCAALLPGVEAEAELLAAITTFFSRVGITSADVGIKVSSRKVLAAVLDRYQVPRENFAQVGSELRVWGCAVLLLRSFVGAS
jgi:histidyl-tRNA synthetase